MAGGIYKRGEGQWLVRIRQGGQIINRTFETHEAAREFREVTVGRITGRVYVDKEKERRTTLADLLTRYETDVTPSKRGAAQEVNRLRAWRREPFAAWPVVSVTTGEIVEWRQRRIAEGRAPSTVSNAMNLLSAVYKIAITEWGFRLDNPVLGVKRPSPREGRNVVLTVETETRLLSACERGPAWLPWVVRIAIETGMRAGEIRRMRWEHVSEFSIFIPKSKNGSARTVPLTEDAEQIVGAMRDALPRRLDGWVFGPPDLPVNEGGFTGWKIVNAFRDACAQAEPTAVTGLTFHDLRHVAITRLAPLHRDALHLSKTTGHKTLAMLARYYNPTAEEQAREIREAARRRAGGSA